MTAAVAFDPQLIRRYDVTGPRYTSYPTATQFHSEFDAAAYRRQAMRSNNGENGPLSLYVHLPFCDTVCFYCACNKIITANRKRVEPYLQRLHAEIALQARLFTPGRPLRQLHWGGGTPTYLSLAQMRELMHVIDAHFNLLDHDRGEYSIEIDPRSVTIEDIYALRELGFNRLSLGVQDFDPEVQRAVNRMQPFEVTEAAISAARGAGFRSLGVDLIYGLPRQSVTSFDRTLDAIIALDPDRLSVFNYAHLPHLFKVQRQIAETDLPPPAAKLDILEHVIRRLTAAGYVYIGMDHFAKPHDELTRAQAHGSLYRNFQGYSTHADCDLIGVGLSAIGKVADSYSQNAKTLEDYYAALDAGRLPIVRGIALSADDRLRRAVITQIICNFKLSFIAIEDRYGIAFQSYFAEELRVLAAMAGDGLLRLGADRLEVSPAGRLLVRNICMVFDRYLRDPLRGGSGLDRSRAFSRAI